MSESKMRVVTCVADISIAAGANPHFVLIFACSFSVYPLSVYSFIDYSLSVD